MASPESKACGAPHLLAVSPDGGNVYVAAYTDDAVVVFEREPTTGALVYLEKQKDGEGGIEGLNGAFSVAVKSVEAMFMSLP